MSPLTRSWRTSTRPLCRAPNAFALRQLSDGTVLVADADRVVRLDALGNLIQTYGLGSDSLLFALNIDPNGKDFWTAGYFSGNVYEYDINSGCASHYIQHWWWHLRSCYCWRDYFRRSASNQCAGWRVHTHFARRRFRDAGRIGA